MTPQVPAIVISDFKNLKSKLQGVLEKSGCVLLLLLKDRLHLSQVGVSFGHKYLGPFSEYMFLPYLGI